MIDVREALSEEQGAGCLLETGLIASFGVAADERR